MVARLVRASTENHHTFDPRESKRTFRFHMSDVGEMVFLPALVKRSGAAASLRTRAAG
jgi:hypothetical protein